MRPFPPSTLLRRASTFDHNLLFPPTMHVVFELHFPPPQAYIYIYITLIELELLSLSFSLYYYVTFDPKNTNLPIQIPMVIKALFDSTTLSNPLSKDDYLALCLVMLGGGGGGGETRRCGGSGCLSAPTMKLRYACSVCGNVK